MKRGIYQIQTMAFDFLIKRPNLPYHSVEAPTPNMAEETHCPALSSEESSSDAEEDPDPVVRKLTRLQTAIWSLWRDVQGTADEPPHSMLRCVNQVQTHLEEKEDETYSQHCRIWNGLKAKYGSFEGEASPPDCPGCVALAIERAVCDNVETSCS